jgi:hypothetical protein
MKTQVHITPHVRPLPQWRDGGFSAGVRMALGGRHFEIDGARHSDEWNAERDAVRSAHAIAQALTREHGDKYEFRLVVWGCNGAEDLLALLAERHLKPPHWLMRDAKKGYGFRAY